jgi:hypothetical protein
MDETCIEVAGLLVSCMVNVIVPHVAVLQTPSGLTKYVKVPVLLGLTDKLLPVPTRTPPQLPVYQRQRAL